MKKLVLLCITLIGCGQVAQDTGFKPGELVEHVAGGPTMVVVEQNGVSVGCSFIDAAYGTGREYKTVWLKPVELRRLENENK